MRDVNRQTLATEFVHDSQAPKSAAVAQRIRDEVHTPTARSAHSAPLVSVEAPGSYVSSPSPAPRVLLPCRVVEPASGSPAGLRVEASRGSSGSPSPVAPAPISRSELVASLEDREYCDIASSSAESPYIGSTYVLKFHVRLVFARRPGAVPGPSRSVSQ